MLVLRFYCSFIIAHYTHTHTRARSHTHARTPLTLAGRVGVAMKGCAAKWRVYCAGNFKWQQLAGGRGGASSGRQVASAGGKCRLRVLSGGWSKTSAGCGQEEAEAKWRQFEVVGKWRLPADGVGASGGASGGHRLEETAGKSSCHEVGGKWRQVEAAGQVEEAN